MFWSSRQDVKIYVDMEKNIVLKKEWPCAGNQETVSRCQDSTARVPGEKLTVEQKTRLETELQIIASKTRLIHIGMHDRCWRGLADHCAVGSRVSLNCNISLSIYTHTEKD